MKIRHLFLTASLLFFLATNAQSKEDIEIENIFWGEKDKYKNVVDTPEKWNNESAIIIYKNVNYDYHKFGKSITYTSSIRKRIKLLDKAAVEEFSEFSFNKRFWSTRGYTWKKGEQFIGIKIIKPTGKEIKIDIDEEAVDADTQKKIAIANLEVGDIIDYYLYKIEPFKSRDEYGFKSVQTTLGEEYHIMDMKLTFETENDFFVNFQSYNGAPDLKEIKTDKRSIRRYELNAQNVEKNDFPRWFYPFAEMPTYKFQVFFARSGKFENRAVAFLPEKENIIKKTVTKEDVIDLYDNKFKASGDISDIKRYLKDQNITSPKKIVEEGFYYMRHYYLTRYLEAAYMQEANIVYYPFTYYGNDFIFIRNQKHFINHFTQFLKEYKIDHEIIVGTKRYNGPIKDLLIEEDVDVLLKVKFKDPIYIIYFDPYTSINEFSPLLENTNAYVLELNGKKKITGIKNSTLKGSKYQDNNSTSTVSISLDNNLEVTTVNRETALKGHMKINTQKNFMYYFDYVYEDYKKYGTKPFLDYVKKKKLKTKYTNELNALKEKLLERQRKDIKKATSNEYDFEIDNHQYKIENTGRFGFDDPFVVSESFNVEKDLIKRAGRNYIFEIGKFIGGQVEIDDKEKKRTNNVYMNYPRSFNNEIILTIPDGYTVSGIDKLNTKVENETGGFTSTATVEGQQLKISTSKYYINNYESNSNWSKMVDFLEAAYQFTQTKILLKKK